jgi:hypothetical protein
LELTLVKEDNSFITMTSTNEISKRWIAEYNGQTFVADKQEQVLHMVGQYVKSLPDNSYRGRMKLYREGESPDTPLHGWY